MFNGYMLTVIEFVLGIFQRADERDDRTRVDAVRAFVDAPPFVNPPKRSLPVQKTAAERARERRRLEGEQSQFLKLVRK